MEGVVYKAGTNQPFSFIPQKSPVKVETIEVSINMRVFTLPWLWLLVMYSGKFSRFSVAEQSTRKLKLGKTPTHRYFTCKACCGCGLLALKCEYYNREIFFWGPVEPFRENFICKSVIFTIYNTCVVHNFLYMYCSCYSIDIYHLTCLLYMYRRRKPSSFVRIKKARNGKRTWRLDVSRRW